MERFSNKDNVLLGYSPRKSFGSPKFPLRNSDVDFHDVFGGPPRRSSNHDWRHSLSETRDSNSSRGEEETSYSRNPWSGLSEKSAFGEEILNRRRYRSDDFFDDIFRGDDSSSSTPRNPGRDPFSSTPASRVLSPVHPLAPEPLGSSSLLSLPTKLAKEMDFPAFASPSRSPYKNKESASTGLGFPSSPRASLSRVLSQVVQRQDGSRNDARPFFRQSPLSHEISLNSEGSPKATKSSSSEINNNSGQFHFSIYKWACKGVPLVMPIRGGIGSSSKGKVKTERSVSELPVSVLQGVEESSKSWLWECENQYNSLVLTPTQKDGVDSPKIIEDLVPAKPEKPLTNFESVITDVPGSNLSQNTGKEIKPGSGTSGAVMDISSCEGREKEIPVSNHEAHKSELKPLHCLFKDDSDTQENDKPVEQARMKEVAVKSMDTSAGDVDDRKKAKKYAGKRNTLNLADVTNSTLQNSPTNSEDKLVRNRIKGKVKEFVKIFNQEAPSKPITNAETRGQRTGIKDMGPCKADYQEHFCATKADGKEVINKKNNRKLTDTPVMVDQVLKQSAKPQLGVSTTAHKISNTYCERNDTSASSSESIPKSFEAKVDNIDDSHCADLNCMVKELSHDQTKQPQNGQHNDEIQVSDAKIRQWSNGKEGNIRSLLSTLQFVLWPESGWKPVPLVDIIEGNSVKRAYQKALLCLHPDKLQQKGAAPHQKYIAEKVFDILQEAWTNFNLLGSF